MNRKVLIDSPPKRIVSLVPSQTELLFYLGLGDQVVGRTKFCIHPADQVKVVTKVGGTKQYHLDKIAELQPDLIIGNKEENDKAQIEALAELYPVWMSDIKNLTDAYEMIESIGSITNTADKALQLNKDIQSRFRQLASIPKDKKVAYFIWQKPYMVAATDTFIDHLLSQAGFINAFAHLERYPEIELEELVRLAPDLILLSSEPFPFKQKHLDFFQNECPNADVQLVDGELFSWYGNRLLHSAGYFLSLH